MIVDQAAINAGFDFLRSAITPMPTNPSGLRQGAVLTARWIGIVSAGWWRIITWRVITGRVITGRVISTGGGSTDGSGTDGSSTDAYRHSRALRTPR
jgi:hypothetical protein